MKSKKLFLMAITAPMLLVGLTSCNNAHKAVHSEFKKSLATTGLDYLYEVTYSDYSWNDVTNWMNSDKRINANQGAFGCSSVHNGNFYGRSFDFCYTDMCEFLVRTPHTSDRFASIGVSIADCNLNEEKVEKINNGTGGDQEKLNERMIPFATVDGINENGVVCNTNVVPAKDLTPQPGEDHYFTHGTNPGKPDLFYQFMPRFILDNATSAKHAVQLLQQRNITAMNKAQYQCDYLGVSKMGYELHCMIADKDDTYIIELVDDHMSVIYGDIMTNYYLTNTSPSGAGFERFHTLWDDYDKGATLPGMKELIQEVQYSPSYNITQAEEDAKAPKWPTEFAGVGVNIVPKDIGEYHLTFYNAEWFFNQIWDKPEGTSVKEGILNAYKTINVQHHRAPAVGGDVPWISTHACVYDIKHRALHLVTQEKTKKVTIEGKEVDVYDFKEFRL